jgi:hypothetical protein
MSTTDTTRTTVRAGEFHPVVRGVESVQPRKHLRDNALRSTVVPVVRVVRSFTCGT